MEVAKINIEEIIKVIARGHPEEREGKPNSYPEAWDAGFEAGCSYAVLKLLELKKEMEGKILEAQGRRKETKGASKFYLGGVIDAYKTLLGAQKEEGGNK